ncbi:MAG: hypothetical protein WA208_04090, partial [Thermoanaerobaculia bacterium]
MKKRPPLLIAAAGLLILLIAIAVVVSRQRVQRHRVFRPAAGAAPSAATVPLGVAPVEQWSEAFRTLPPDDLAALLEEIEKKHPDLHARWSLDYLHARALLESG